MGNAEKTVRFRRVPAHELFNTEHYQGRVFCPNCGSFYSQITGSEEPEHLVLCKRCDRFFVWLVQDRRLTTIGSPLGAR